METRTKSASYASKSENSAKNHNAPRLWPSERIPQGGLFHSAKIEYSKETADLLNLLMKESRMSMMMRKQINQHLENGEPLPKPKPPPVYNLNNNPEKEALAILQRAHNAKRKSLKEIRDSGCYEMPIYRPKPDNKLPSEKAKKLLQETMSGFRVPSSNMKPKRREKEPSIHIGEEEMINELLNQINERAEWLAEMEELGEGKRYRDEIREQIAQRLRQIKALETKLKLQTEGSCRYVE